MTIEDAIKLIHKTTNGALTPIYGIEGTAAFAFFVVTDTGASIGNNAQFTVTKDGAICDWTTMGVPLPDKYQGEFVKEWSPYEIRAVKRKMMREDLLNSQEKT